MELQRFCCRYKYLCITPLSVNYSVLHIGSRLSGPDRNLFKDVPRES
jgi:hypothetical protein